MGPHSYPAFVHLKAQASWLSLDRAARNALVQRELMPLLEKYPLLVHRHFDTEAFCGPISDIELFSFDDPRMFYAFFEAFRDSEIIAAGHFQIVDIYFSIESGYQEYEARLT